MISLFAPSNSKILIINYKSTINFGEFDDEQEWYNRHIKIQKKVVYYKNKMV